jgi:hypothetical protein
MPSSGFEPAISAIEQPQTYALDRAATKIGPLDSNISCFFNKYILVYPLKLVNLAWYKARKGQRLRACRILAVKRAEKFTVNKQYVKVTAGLERSVAVASESVSGIAGSINGWTFH